MFGKIMSVSDDLMWRYYELLTDLRADQIADRRDAAARGEVNPRNVKVELAKLVIADFHTREAAEAAEEDFNRVFKRKEVPDEIEERTLPSNPQGWDLSFLLVTVGLADSKAEARRLIQQGGVYVDGERQMFVNTKTLWKAGMSTLIKVGKRRFVRVHFA
jgi:tyrosyl-tRNA synthetase